MVDNNANDNLYSTWFIIIQMMLYIIQICNNADITLIYFMVNNNKDNTVYYTWLIKYCTL